MAIEFQSINEFFFFFFNLYNKFGNYNFLPLQRFCQYWNFKFLSRSAILLLIKPFFPKMKIQVHISTSKRHTNKNEHIQGSGKQKLECGQQHFFFFFLIGKQKCGQLPFTQTEDQVFHLFVGAFCTNHLCHLSMFKRKFWPCK